MKKTLAALLAISALIFADITLAFAQDGPQSIQAGDLEVFVIQDGEGAMGADLVPGIENDPVMKSYFNAGPLPSVYRAYYFQNGDRKVLIDTGWGREQSRKGHLLEELAKAGVKPEEITDILMTHLDIDHVGGLVHEGNAVFPNARLWLSRPELDAWSAGNAPGRKAGAVEKARQALKVYGDRVHPFNFGDEPVPGVLAIDASGHTPGHTAYELSSGQDKILIVGDLLHIAPVQLIKPELATVYDGDAQKAADSRKRLLQRAVESGAIFAGMHFPGISPVRERPDGGYVMREPR